MTYRFVLNSTEYGALALQKEPGGWKNIEVMLKRSLEYHGVFYEAMAPLSFKCRSGKEYIDKAIEEIGIDAEISITIYISCSTGTGSVEAPDYSIDYSDDYGSMLTGSNSPIFEVLFEGVLELKNYAQTSETTTVSLIQSDFTQKILNRLETQVEVTKNVSLDDVPLTPISGFPSAITLHSKTLLLKTIWEEYDASGTVNIVFPNDTVNIEIPMVLVSDDIGGAQGTDSPYIFTALTNGNASGYENTQPIFVNTTSENITVDIDIDIDAIMTVKNSLGSTGPSATQMKFYLQMGGTNFSYFPEPLILQTSTGITLNDDVNFDIPLIANATGTYTIPPGHKIFLTPSLSNIQGDNTNPATFTLVGFQSTTFDVSISNQSTTASSQGVIFKIHELGAAIAQRITSQEDAFRSTLLGRKNSLPTAYDSNGCGSFMGSLNGKHVRGFQVADAPYFGSMSDYFKTVNSILNCGLGVDKVGNNTVLVIEKKSFFYNTEVVLQCPNAKEVTISAAKEYYISDVYIGYEKWETENVNGIDEFNTKRQYNTGIKAIESRLNVESPWIASMYSIELARRQGVSTYDYRYDKDNFIISLKRGVDGSGNPNQLNLAEKDEAFNSVTGFISPETAYNLRISPARNLLNHFDVIGSSITKYPDRAVKFVYGEGNFKVVTDINEPVCDNSFGNLPLSESQDITTEESGRTPIWIPEYIDFEYPLTFSDYLMLKANSKKCIEVSKASSDFIKGYIIDIRYKPVGGIAKFRLLRAYGN